MVSAPFCAPGWAGQRVNPHVSGAASGVLIRVCSSDTYAGGPRMQPVWREHQSNASRTRRARRPISRTLSEWQCSRVRVWRASTANVGTSCFWQRVQQWTGFYVSSSWQRSELALFTSLPTGEISYLFLRLGFGDSADRTHARERVWTSILKLEAWAAP